MRYIYFFLTFLILTKFINSQKESTPSKMILSGVIYDHHPSRNPNFECPTGELTKGLVKTNLNVSSRVPELNSLSSTDKINQKGRIIKPELFQYFFAPNNNPLSFGNNKPIPINLELNYDQIKGVYVYDNQEFFPIDNKGFDLENYQKYYDYSKKPSVYHNYHFCLKISSNFVYKGYEVFNFIGDDDVWVFINNLLAVDLGGLHQAARASINLKTLGLTVGRSYPIDFFYCERHTVKSTIRIETNLEIICNYYDYCGVCNGDGSTCCNPLVDCNDNDPCTVDYCPSGNSIIQGGIKSILNYCQHVPMVVENDDICFTKYCDKSTGNIEAISTLNKCENKFNQCLDNTGCISNLGCQYQSLCTGVCHIKDQCNNGECVSKSSEYCAHELDGDNPDLCSIYSCNSNGAGCIKEQKCKKNTTNPCIATSCNPSTGECINTETPGDKCDCGCNIKNKCMRSHCTKDGKCEPVLREEIDDGNICTDDHCDPCTGIINHVIASKCLNCDKC